MMSLDDDRGAHRAWGYLVTGNYFESLGIKPALGRFFTPAEDTHPNASPYRSEEHTSELQSLRHLVCRLLLEKKKHLDPVFLKLPLSSRFLVSMLLKGGSCGSTLVLSEQVCLNC